MSACRPHPRQKAAAVEWQLSLADWLDLKSDLPYAEIIEEIEKYLYRSEMLPRS